MFSGMFCKCLMDLKSILLLGRISHTWVLLKLVSVMGWKIQVTIQTFFLTGVIMFHNLDISSQSFYHAILNYIVQFCAYISHSVYISLFISLFWVYITQFWLFCTILSFYLITLEFISCNSEFISYNSACISCNSDYFAQFWVYILQWVYISQFSLYLVIEIFISLNSELQEKKNIIPRKQASIDFTTEMKIKTDIVH